MVNSATVVVLEPTALGTMFLLDVYFGFVLYDNMSNWPFKCLVSERTIEELENYLESLSSNNDRMGSERYGGKIVPRIISSEQLSQVAAKLRPKLERLIASVKQHCEIVPGSTLSNIPTAHREAIRCFGAAGAESVEIAKARDAVLWTDDHVISELSTIETGCKCTWTQIACKSAIFRNQPNMYQKASIFLLSLKYDPTSFSFEDAVWAAEEARWNTNLSPFAAVIKCLGRPSIPIEQILGLATVLMKAVWSSPIYGLQATDYTLIMLSEIKRREPSLNSIRHLQLFIDRLFGLNVIAAANVHRVFDNWLAANRQGGIIIP